MNWRPFVFPALVAGLVAACCYAISVTAEQIEFQRAMLAKAPVVNRPPRPEYGNPTIMVASWYGPAYCGRRTASGVIFDCQALTAAHRTLPFGTRLLVLREGRQVVVTVNDRGPLEWTGRDLDLSLAAAQALGMVRTGVSRVQVRRVLQ